jgi:ubiquitin-conjugating enzyme E2 D/E
MARRLQREMEEIQGDPLDWASVEIVDNNLFFWSCQLQGPEESPFENGWFTLHLNLPNEYPFKHPEVQFQTKMFHPNIDKDGKICTHVLGDNWSPQIKIKEVLLIVRQMLREPSLENPLDEEAAIMYRNNRPEFEKKVKALVKQHAQRRN